MNRAIVAAGGAIALLVAAASAWAQDAAAGQKLAAGICQACHGLDGIAKQPDAANHAGQRAGYLPRQIHAGKAGWRKYDQMAVVA
ncbi:MAG: hypothetical protein JO209_03765, partial [Acidisphaera sp.]|nr:hypothetical protein [Acidisphaera sp.]